MKKENILVELKAAGISVFKEIENNIPEKQFNIKLFSLMGPIRY